MSLKLTADSEIIYKGDNLLNYDGAGIYFTSYEDDAHGGDTNGDGATTTPADGDWSGIFNDDVNVGEFESGANILYDEIH